MVAFHLNRIKTGKVVLDKNIITGVAIRIIHIHFNVPTVKSMKMIYRGKHINSSSTTSLGDHLNDERDARCGWAIYLLTTRAFSGSLRNSHAHYAASSDGTPPSDSNPSVGTSYHPSLSYSASSDDAASSDTNTYVVSANEVECLLLREELERLEQEETDSGLVWYFQWLEINRISALTHTVHESLLNTVAEFRERKLNMVNLGVCRAMLLLEGHDGLVQGMNDLLSEWYRTKATDWDPKPSAPICSKALTSIYPVLSPVSTGTLKSPPECMVNFQEANTNKLPRDNAIYEPERPQNSGPVLQVHFS